MKGLIVGAGSIGRRHANNLVGLGVDELIIVDCEPERAAAVAAQTGGRVAASLEEGLRASPDFAVIATPSNLHLEHAIACARSGAHLLIEKPLATSLDGTAALLDEVRKQKLCAMVGSNLRYDEVYRAVRRILDEGRLGRIYAARFYFGYHLPLWRPASDYRTLYSAHRAQGGGVMLDAIHELDLVLWWFGDVRRGLSMVRNTGALEIDSEDLVDLVLETRSGVQVNVHLNYRDQIYRRHVWVMGSEGVVEGDFARRSVVLRARDGAEERLDFVHDINAMYVGEAEHFLTLVRANRGTAAVEDDLRALELALAARDHGPVFTLPRQSPRLERVPVVIQARMGSTRLPGKVLMKTVGQTMFSLLVERLRRARRVDGIYVATSEKPADEQIVAEAERLGVPWFRGSENDVLSRYLGVARQFDLPAVVRITADCPLMDPDVLDAVIEKFTREQPDYCCNTIPRSVPNGLDVEVFSRATLERISRDAVDPLDREHVTRHIYRHPERFECLAAAPYDPQMAARRWTLDTPADYQFLSTVFEELYPHNPRFGTEDVLALLARRPELEANLRAAIGAHE